jgi:hypothetical protein
MSVPWWWSPWASNLVADKEDPDVRDVRTGLSFVTGYPVVRFIGKLGYFVFYKISSLRFCLLLCLRSQIYHPFSFTYITDASMKEFGHERNWIIDRGYHVRRDRLADQKEVWRYQRLSCEKKQGGRPGRRYDGTGSYHVRRDRVVDQEGGMTVPEVIALDETGWQTRKEVWRYRRLPREKRPGSRPGRRCDGTVAVFKNGRWVEGDGTKNVVTFIYLHVRYG